MIYQLLFLYLKMKINRKNIKEIINTFLQRICIALLMICMVRGQDCGILKVRHIPNGAKTWHQAID